MKIKHTKISNMKNIKLIAMLLFAGSFAFLISCRKGTLNESIQSAQDNVSIETELGNIYDAASGYAQEDGLTGKTDATVLPSGAIVTFQDSAFVSQDGTPLTFTIDYGALGSTAPKGLLCKDGRYRAGKINVSLKEKFGTADNQITVSIPSANDYYVGNGTDMRKVTGTKTVTRQGSAKTWSVVVSNATLETQNGTIQWNANRTLTQTVDVPGAFGDEYTITGSAQGVNAKGEAFSVVTTEPLVKKIQIGCLSTFVSGVLELTNSKNEKFTIDYDPYNNSACDKAAEVSFRNRKRIINVW